jgi:hypothetical protein
VGIVEWQWQQQRVARQRHAMQRLFV